MRVEIASGKCRTAFAILVVATVLLPPALGQSTNSQKRKPASRRAFERDGGVPIYKSWLDEDVVWIITAEERAAFMLLKNDEQRDQFVEAFWARRNPTPDVFNSEFQVEHYRRIIYANDHFSGRVPGWETDRGRIYIVYGPPDKIDSNPAAEDQEKTPDGKTSPREVWRYRYLEGVGQDVVLDFLDVCNCGDLQMRVPPDLKDALFSVPGGLGGQHGDREEPGGRTRFYLKDEDPPQVRFKDLETKANSRLKSNALPFEITSDVTHSTDVTSLVTIALAFQNRDLTFVDKSGTHIAALRIFGRVITLTGHVAEVFEETPEIISSSQSESSSGPASSTFAEMLALRKGRYRIDVVVGDANSDRWGKLSKLIIVPDR